MSSISKSNRRITILTMLLLGIMAIFVVRLFYLQVVRHDYYVAQADREHIKRLEIPAERGEIYAMNGTTPVRLVMNESVFTAFADPMIIDEPDKVAEVVRRVAGGNVRDNIDELIARTDTRYQVLATQLTRTQAETIREESLRGVGFQQETQRVYPEGQLASQVLGFVDASGEGRYGIEAGLNDELQGEDGLLQSVTDVSNVPLTIGDNNIDIPARHGDNVVLTIDRNVQAKTEKALAEGLQRTGATHGSVLVMNPQNGEVVAMANLPTYSPSEYSRVNDIAVYNNPIISSPFEPGSVLKTFTLATGIDKGVIAPNSQFVNTDTVRVGDRTITNATRGQTGNITMQTALDFSLNTGMVHVAYQLGDGQSITLQSRTTLYEYFYERLRLGQMTGIELAGEVGGTIRPPSDPDGGAVRYSNMTFGQGLDVTMLQVSAGFSALVNGGTYYSPTVVAGTVERDTGVFTAAETRPSYESVIQPSTSDQMRDMIYKGRQAFHGDSDTSGYYVGGKTGTSQTLRDGQYILEETIGTYLGFGGASGESPQYVIMVQVSGRNMNLHGNRHAMPIFTDISNWLLDYYKLAPEG